jgi:hypothetical protein
MNYYKHINELPVANWFEIISSGNLCYLLKCDFFESKNKIKELNEAELQILNETFIEMPYQFEKVDNDMAELQKDVALLELNYAITEDVRLLNKLRSAKKKIEDIMKSFNSAKSISLIEQTALLITGLKINIDIYSCSTQMWYCYRNMFIEQNKPHKNENS